MKKLITILLLVLAISGCASNSDESSFWRPQEFVLHPVYPEGDG
jgi:hypothetical protein